MAAIGSLGAAGITQAALAVTGIVLARLLGPEDRGYLALFILLPLVVVQLGALGLPVATTYYIAENRSQAGLVVRSLLLPAFVQLLLLVAIYFGLVMTIFSTRTPTVRLAALISLIAVPAALMQYYGLAILQGQQRFVAFNMLRTLPALLNVPLALLLWRLRADLIITTSLLMLSTLVTATLTLTILPGGLRIRHLAGAATDRTTLLLFGIRSLVGSVYPVESFRPEQFFIGLVLSPAALGLYVVALAFTNLPIFVAQSLGMVAYPRIAEERSSRGRRRLMWQYFWVAAALAAFAVVVLELAVAPMVPILFGRRFSGAIAIGRLLLIGSLLFSARRILAEGLKGAGAPTAGTVAEVASWLVLVPGLIVSAPHWGLMGVAVTMILTHAVSLAVLIWLEFAWTLPESSPLAGASEGVIGTSN